MIDLSTAANIAEKILNEHFNLDGDVVVVFDPTEDADYYYFQYNSRKYLETGDLVYAIVEGRPIGINKHDGSVV
jgi:hypothetical protein